MMFMLSVRLMLTLASMLLPPQLNAAAVTAPKKNPVAKAAPGGYG